MPSTLVNIDNLWVLVLLVLQVEVQLKAHTKNVRSLDYNPATNAVMTCSFDKTVKVFS